MNLDKYTLSAGKHDSPQHGTCIMELYSIMTGAEFTDTMPCISNVLQSHIRAFNDGLPDDQRQRLKAYLPRIDGLRNDVKEERLMFLCADRAVRVFAPIALRRAGEESGAQRLESLPPVVDKETALVARDAAYNAAWADNAANAAYAAANAAYNADNAAWAANAAANAATSAYAWDEGFQLLDDMIAILEEGLTDYRLLPCESECERRLEEALNGK